MATKHTISLTLATALWLCASPGYGDPAQTEPRTPHSAIASEVDDVGADFRAESGTLANVSPLPDGFLPGSTYGFRTSPRTGRRTFHAGVDFLAPRGTPVRVVTGGIVERVTRNSVPRTRFAGYGTAVVIRHPRARVWTFYAHLDSVDVRVGQTLRAGQLVGTVGNSANRRFRGMVCHLHFEVRRARPRGRSPFPAPYRRFNLDPGAWLRSIGVQFGEADGPTAELDAPAWRPFG